MAKPKITVRYLGTVIGSRRTDRKYTHAVIATDFREDRYRARHERAFENNRVNRDKNFAHCGEAMLPSYKYASVVSDVQRAGYAAQFAAGRGAYEAEALKRHEERLAADCAAAVAPFVVSYHSSADLAHKAASSSYLCHYHTVRVVAVDPTNG